jgi:hypothetical protein
MKKNYLFAMLALTATLNLYAQNSYLKEADGFRSREILPELNVFSCFDVDNQTLYAQDGDSINVIDLVTHETLYKIDNPEGYNAFPTFVRYSPADTILWAGYSTSQNMDDRIYAFNVKTKQWTMVASFTASYDMEFWEDHVLISGTNSADWGVSNAIYLLDESGENNHRKLIETMGSPAGFALDQEGNLYLATASFSETNGLFSWSSEQIANILNNPDAPFLTLTNAVHLATISAASSDTETDEAGNIFFNINNFSGKKSLARWNETPGTDYNYDVIAYSDDDTDWFTYIKAVGHILSSDPGNELISLSFGRPLASVYKARGPLLVSNLPVMMRNTDAESFTFDLNDYFSHPDDEMITFSIKSNSFPNVAVGTITNADFRIEFLATGQTTILIEAESNGLKSVAELTIGVQPIWEGEYVISDMENNNLTPESYWNGSDESGGFESGLGYFYNNYNTEWGSWAGWAHSNKTDNTTPGWFNQYSAITGSGINPDENESSTYAVAYSPENLKFENPSAHQIKGFFVTNTAYTGLSMKYGDDFSKKFGGPDGSDPDWFLLKVLGIKDGTTIDSVGFYLADYRFEDNAKDYVVETWQWIELSSLGKVDSIALELSSSDNGEWGMNTPAYFAVDDLYIVPDLAPEIASMQEDITLIFGDEGFTRSLNGIFTDPDDNDELIEITILDDYNHDLISVETIDGNIKITSVANLSESTEINMEAVSNGKTITGSFTVTVQSTVGINENDLSGVIVYPNPATNHFRLVGVSHEVIHLELITLSGQVVLRENNFNPSSVVEINNLAEGTYLLRIITNKDNQWTKVVIR